MTNQSSAVPSAKTQSIEAYLFLIGTGLCWAANTIFGQLAVGEASPMIVVLGRWTGVMILSLIFLRSRIRRDWPVLRPHLPFLALMGTIGFTVFNSLFYLSAYSTTALNMGILQGSIPVFVLIGAIVIYRAPLTKMQFLGVLLTVTGVVTVASGGSLDRLLGLVFNQGDILMVIACFMYAVYTVGLRNRPAVSPLSLFAVMATAAFITAIPGAVIEASMGQTIWPTQKGWMVIAAITLFPSFLAQILFIQGVDRIGPARAGVFMNLVPIFGAFMAVVFLGESFVTYHAIALSLVLLGIFVSEKFKSR